MNWLFIPFKLSFYSTINCRRMRRDDLQLRVNGRCHSVCRKKNRSFLLSPWLADEWTKDTSKNTFCVFNDKFLLNCYVSRFLHSFLYSLYFNYLPISSPNSFKTRFFYCHSFDLRRLIDFCQINLPLKSNSMAHLPTRSTNHFERAFFAKCLAKYQFKNGEGSIRYGNRGIKER